MNSTNIDKEVLEILQDNGLKTPMLAYIEKINSDKYTLMYTTHDNEVCYEQADTIEQIKRILKKNFGDQDGWKLKHIFHSGKLLKYRIHIVPTIEFIK